MTVEIKDGNTVITLPLQNPHSSKSGKSKIVATTNGFVQSTAQVQDKPVFVAVNAIIKGG